MKRKRTTPKSEFLTCPCCNGKGGIPKSAMQTTKWVMGKSGQKKRREFMTILTFKS